MRIFRKIFLFLFISKVFLSLSAKEPLPNGYKDILLGMSLEDTKQELIKDTDFGYHGDRDVSLLPGENRMLIETDAERGLGSNFLTHCWFQFANDQLYIITINMNHARIDYYSIFTTLKEKYGEPDTITPQAATWKNSEVTMSLEKPLTLKYIDNETFKSLQTSSNIAPASSEVTQQMFLDKL
jgi:hypothetical protein